MQLPEVRLMRDSNWSPDTTRSFTLVALRTSAVGDVVRMTATPTPLPDSVRPTEFAGTVSVPETMYVPGGKAIVRKPEPLAVSKQLMAAVSSVFPSPLAAGHPFEARGTLTFQTGPIGPCSCDVPRLGSATWASRASMPPYRKSNAMRKRRLIMQCYLSLRDGGKLARESYTADTDYGELPRAAN